MYSLVKSPDGSRTLVRELPSAAFALILAEVFYKFHSFTLECLAFLATWFVLSWFAHLLVPRR